MRHFGLICAALLALSAPAAEAKVTLVSLMKWCLAVQDDRVRAPFLMRRVADAPETYQGVTQSNVGPVSVTLTYTRGTVICEIDGTVRRGLTQADSVQVRWQRASKSLAESLEYLAGEAGIAVGRAGLEEGPNGVRAAALYKCTGTPAVMYVEPRRISHQSYIVPLRSKEETRNATFYVVAAGPLQQAVKTEQCS